MNYPETLDYLYRKLPMFSRLGSSAFKKDLTNTRRLCDHLGNPHEKFKSIHIGGTNGKGSVSHMLAAILQASGYKTGLYTSPHLFDFRERIRINGVMADEDFIVEFVQKIKPLIEEIEPSFFEITVAMAFEYFAKQRVDVAVIEVGLGGRLDSTNVITPELSVITNIGWDHMNMLGNTLEAIAFEKAGIIKAGVPVIIGETGPKTESVFRHVAKEKAAPITFADSEFEVLSFEWKERHLVVDLFDKQTDSIQKVTTDLTGIYQLKNICTAMSVVKALQRDKMLSLDLPVEALKEVKQTTGLKGRWDVVHEHPMVVLEVAHNEDGLREMLRQVEMTDHNRLHFIIGFVRDKDVNRVLSLFPKNADYYFSQADIPRALSATELQALAANSGLNGNSFANVNEALKEAMSHAGVNDLVIVCGSIFLVAEVREMSDE